MNPRYLRVSAIVMCSTMFLSAGAWSQGAPAAEGQWVQAAAPSFPALPQTVVEAAQVSTADPGRTQAPAGMGGTPQSGAQARPGGAAAGQGGVVPLAPLVPPAEVAFDVATQMVAPFTPGQVEALHGTLDQNRRAMSIPPVQAIPESRSVSVNLSPGAAVPILRTMPGETSTLVFLDETGAPWPLAAAPRISNDKLFYAEWLKSSPIVVVSAKTFYEQGNLTVFLQGLVTPVIVKLATGEARSTAKTRTVDYRLDLRVPGRGPNAQAPIVTQGQIALYDTTMQAFLDGVPPEKARVVKTVGDTGQRTQAWQMDGSLYLRTPLGMETAFDQTIGAADGTRVYKLPPTPFVMLSELGHLLQLQLYID